jgi:DNA-binding transcriptional regulator YiaG
MQDLPRPVPGPELAAQRKALGIRQTDLAARLEMHRVTLRGWERAAEVSPLQAARYQRALREIIADASGSAA